MAVRQGFSRCRRWRHLNRRETRRLGQDVRTDLRRRAAITELP
jgi:hypothetical protein